MEFVKRAIARTGCGGPVLEVGSYNVNGSVRPLFGDVERFPSYVGIDMRAGPGVDQVVNSQYIPRPDGSFGVVVSTETLEHDNRFWLSLNEMRRLLRDDGTLILTTRGIEYPKHDYPSDYYRFTKEGLAEALLWAGFKNIEAEENAADKGVYATARV